MPRLVTCIKKVLVEVASTRTYSTTERNKMGHEILRDAEAAIASTGAPAV